MTSQPAVSPCGYPLKLAPQFVARVWGSTDISLLYPPSEESLLEAPRPERVGEVWLTGNESRVANGPFAGTALADVARRCGAALLGKTPAHPSGDPVFPLLIKFLFTEDKLSVQLHPHDARAAASASWGKTEMWHVVHAGARARLAIGFTAEAAAQIERDPSRLRAAAESGAIEQMLDWRPVRTGETFFVPAGTVHAIGPELVICEIQQNSDITYRLYDYNRPGADGRPRALHIEEALEVLRPRTEGGRTSPLQIAAEGMIRTYLAACPYFAAEHWAFQEPFVLDTGGRMEIWIGLEGRADFRALAGAGETVSCGPGELVVLPADLRRTNIRTWLACAFLRVYIPDLEQDVLAPLRAHSFSSEQLRALCFPMQELVRG